MILSKCDGCESIFDLKYCRKGCQVELLLYPAGPSSDRGPGPEDRNLGIKKFNEGGSNEPVLS